MLRRSVPGGGFGEALLFAVLWFLAELSRGQAMFDLPAWLAIGYAQIDTPLAGWAPVVGVHGVGFLAVLSAALLVASPGWGRGRAWGATAAAAIWAAGAGMSLVA